MESSNTSKTTASIKETSVGNDTNVTDLFSMENETTVWENNDPTEDYDYTKDDIQDEDSTDNSNNDIFSI